MNINEVSTELPRGEENGLNGSELDSPIGTPSKITTQSDDVYRWDKGDFLLLIHAIQACGYQVIWKDVSTSILNSPVLSCSANRRRVLQQKYGPMRCRSAYNEIVEVGKVILYQHSNCSEESKAAHSGGRTFMADEKIVDCVAVRLTMIRVRELDELILHSQNEMKESRNRMELIRTGVFDDTLRLEAVLREQLKEQEEDGDMLKDREEKPSKSTVVQPDATKVATDVASNNAASVTLSSMPQESVAMPPPAVVVGTNISSTLIADETPKSVIRRASWSTYEPDRKKQRTLARPVKSHMLDVVEALTGSEWAAPFVEPVSPKDAPDYGAAMKQAMDLSFIELRVSNGLITTIEMLWRDILLLVANAFVFNDATTDVYHFAHNLRAVAAMEMRKLWERTYGDDIIPGLKIVREATEHDKKEEWPQALAKYDIAIDHFERASRAEKNPKSVALLKQKIIEYRNRTVTIRQQLDVVPDTFEHAPAIDWSSLQLAEGGVVVSSSSSPSAANKSIADGVRFIEEATYLDDQRRFQEALILYEKGLEAFLGSRKTITNPQLKASVSEKCKIYLDRAEKLKKWLKSRKYEVNEAATPYVQKAVELCEKAIQCEQEQQQDEAKRLYTESIKQFRVALQKEDDQKMKNMISAKMIETQTRLERNRLTKQGGFGIQMGLKPGEKYKDPTKKRWFG